LDSLEGLGPLRLHDLRHNVVSWDVSRGVSLEIAGKNVGHRSRQATEIYAHFAPNALQAAADARVRAMKVAVEQVARADSSGPE
jgi:integrase